MVCDTNIWRDFHEGGILTYLFTLDYIIHIPKDVLEFELMHYSWSQDLLASDVQLECLTGEEIEDCDKILGIYVASDGIEPSYYDRTCLALAIKREWVLATNENCLKAIADRCAIRVENTCSLLQELINNSMISKLHIADAIESMLNANRNLPGGNEYEKIKRLRQGLDLLCNE